MMPMAVNEPDYLYLYTLFPILAFPAGHQVSAEHPCLLWASTSLVSSRGLHAPMSELDHSPLSFLFFCLVIFLAHGDSPSVLLSFHFCVLFLHPFLR